MTLPISTKIMFFSKHTIQNGQEHHILKVCKKKNGKSLAPRGLHFWQGEIFFDCFLDKIQGKVNGAC